MQGGGRIEASVEVREEWRQEGRARGRQDRYFCTRKRGVEAGRKSHGMGRLMKNYSHAMFNFQCSVCKIAYYVYFLYRIRHPAY